MPDTDQQKNGDFRGTSTDKLRDEIMASQEAGAVYLKMKITFVAALVSAALGIGISSTNPELYVLLCLIPFVCAFCDMMGEHIGLRIKVIAIYLHRQGDPYETYIWQTRKHRQFLYEAAAGYFSTTLMNLGLIAFGIFGRVEGWCRSWVYVVCGVLGLLASFWIKYTAEGRMRGLDELRPVDQK